MNIQNHRAVEQLRRMEIPHTYFGKTITIDVGRKFITLIVRNNKLLAYVGNYETYVETIFDLGTFVYKHLYDFNEKNDCLHDNVRLLCEPMFGIDEVWNDVERIVKSVTSNIREHRFTRSFYIPGLAVVSLYIRINTRDVTVSNISMRPECCNRGAFTKLIKQLIDFLEPRKMRLVIENPAERNMDFYTRMGFVRGDHQHLLVHGAHNV